LEKSGLLLAGRAQSPLSLLVINYTTMNIRLVGLCLLLMLIGKIGFAQDCDAFTVTVSEDTTLCTSGEPVPLSASFSIPPLTVEWSPATGLADPNAANTTATATATQVYTVTAQAIGENLIFNGDFEFGGVGFTTDYDLASGGPNGPLHNEGEYLVSDDPNATHEDFAPCGDHTSGNGNMMVVNSSGQQNDVWCQVVSVSTGTDYAFSAWVASVFSDNPANLQFSFDGVLLGSTVEVTTATCEWTPFYATWNSGGSTSVNICIANVNEASSGNDFALDDISFGPVCEVSAEVTVTLGNAPDPVFEVDCNATTGSIELSWAPVSNAGSYIVEVLDAPGGTFSSDTSYLIQGLTENQEVNYELFAVSPEGCQSIVFSGNCFTISCPEYSFELNGDAEVCEGNNLDLVLNIETNSPGPFTINYTYDGLSGTLPGLQPGANTFAIPVTVDGLVEISAFTDLTAPVCSFDGAFPALNISVVSFPVAGVGEDLTFCVAADSLLALGGILSGADSGGLWEVLEGELPENTLDANTGQISLANLITPGNYQIGYLQNNGICPPDSAFFNLEILALPEVETSGSFSLDCETEEVAIGVPPVPGLIYLWEALDGGALSDPNSSNPTTAVAGTYGLFVTDSVTGCTRSATVEVVDNRTNPVLAVSVTAPGCSADGGGIIQVDTVIGGQEPYLYSLNDEPFQQAPVFEGLNTGDYRLRVQDGGGCEGEVTITLDEILPTDIQLVSLTLGAQPVIVQGDSVELTVQTIGGTFVLPDSLVWEPAVCEGCISVVVSPVRTTSYTVSGITAEGCLVTATIVVEVDDNLQRIYVPNAFSPNEDGTNDFLLPYAGPEFTRGISFRIFNRWGGLTYELTDFPLGTSFEGWNGRFNGEPSPTGVYVYHLVIERSNGQLVEQTGEVHLIR